MKLTDFLQIDKAFHFLVGLSVTALIYWLSSSLMVGVASAVVVSLLRSIYKRVSAGSGYNLTEDIEDSIALLFGVILAVALI